MVLEADRHRACIPRPVFSGNWANRQAEDVTSCLGIRLVDGQKAAVAGGAGVVCLAGPAAVQGR